MGTARASPIKDTHVMDDLDSSFSPGLRVDNNVLHLSIPFGSPLSQDRYGIGQRMDAFTKAECARAKGTIAECEERSQEYIERLRERAQADEQRLNSRSSVWRRVGARLRQQRAKLSGTLARRANDTPSLLQRTMAMAVVKAVSLWRLHRPR